MIFRDLRDDRDRRDELHDVVLAVCTQTGEGYVRTLGRLTEWEGEAALRNGGDEGLTLDDVLAAGGITSLEVAPTPDVTALAAAAETRAPVTADEADASGGVPFGPGIDVAHRLHDDEELTRQYLSACEFGYDGGREQFVRDFRQLGLSGFDLVGQLQLEQHRREVVIAAREAATLERDARPGFLLQAASGAGEAVRLRALTNAVAAFSARVSGLDLDALFSPSTRDIFALTETAALRRELAEDLHALMAEARTLSVAPPDAMWDRMRAALDGDPDAMRELLAERKAKPGRGRTGRGRGGVQ